MISRAHASWIGLLCAAVIGFPVAMLPAWALSHSQDQLGNVFLTNETVTIPVSGGSGNTVEWTAVDYYGTTVGQGTVTLSGGSATITPNLGQRGYFDLYLVEKASSSTVDQKETSFAVLTPLSLAGMADSRFGVQTHFSQSHGTDLMPIIERAGIAHLRDEQYWASIESQPGVYTYPSKFTNYMALAASAGIQPLITLDWSNPHYDYEEGQFTAPHTENGREGYANYALNLLDQYGSQIKFFEVWNEYNAGTFIKGPATADKPYYYYLMLKKVYEEVKAVRPDVDILAGGTVPVAHGFLDDLFAEGGMPYLDAVSVHPYRGVPEGIDLEIAELRELIRSYNGGQDKPIWATEFSLNVNTVPKQYDAASYLVRTAIQMLSEDVARMYYYLSRDDGNFPYRGLVASHNSSRGKYTPHPAYVAYANLIRQAHGYTCDGRIGGTSTTTYVYELSQGADKVYVLWATAPTTITAAASGTRVRVGLMGEESSLVPVNGTVTLDLTSDPIYVRGSLGSLTEAPNPVIADSVSGYSNVQGQHGWYYGHANLGSTATYSPAAFEPMTWGIWQGDNYRWKGTSTYHFQGINGMHPSGRWTIRRWVSDQAGTVTLSAQVRRSSSSGDGVIFRVFIDGSEVLNQAVAPAEEVDVELQEIELSVGSLVDFALVQGGDNSYDSTGFEARISMEQGTATGTLAPVADAYVRGGSHSGNNFGANEELWVKEDSNSGYDRRAYLRFELGGFETITSARLNLLPVTVGGGGATSTYEVRLVTNDTWQEGGITWDNQPGGSTVLATISGGNIHVGIPLEIELTSAAQQEALGDGSLSLEIVSMTEGGSAHVVFGSRESASPPFLDFSGAAGGLEVDLESDADVYVRGGNKSATNYGTAPDLWMKEDSNESYDRQIYLRFNLGAVTAGIADATLVLKPTTVGSQVAGGTYRVALVEDDSWIETGMTWNNRPAGSTVLADISGTSIQTGAPLQIDLTAIAQQEKAGDGMLSLLLYSLVPNSSGHVVFASHESGADQPVLRLTEAGGVEVGAEDATVRGGGESTTNYGTAPDLWVKEDASAGYDRRAYLRFNLSGGGPVSSATLRLMPVTVGDDVDTATYDVLLVADDSWQENTITWSNMPSGSTWLAEIDGALVQAGVPLELDLTAAAQAEAGGDGQFSIVIVPLVEGGQRHVVFGSSESASPPVLILE